MLLEEVLDRLADDLTVDRADVPGHLLKQKVWVAGLGQPGCLYDGGPYYCRSKRQAIELLLDIADNGEGAPRGMRAALERDGVFFNKYFRAEISQVFLGVVI